MIIYYFQKESIPTATNKRVTRNILLKHGWKEISKEEYERLSSLRAAEAVKKVFSK